MFIFHSPPPSLAQKASCVVSCCWLGCSPLHQMLAWRIWPILWHEKALCVYEAILECPVSAFSLWVTALTESIGILCLHLLRRPLVTWTSSGIWGRWHVCNWRHWDRPWLVLQLTGNLLQYGDTLLLVSQVVHLAPRHWMALTISSAHKQAVERALHFE